MTRTDNGKVIEQGFQKAKDLVFDAVYGQTVIFCESLLEHAKVAKDYMNLTGNTITSYTVGLYWDGNLEELVEISGQKPPVRNKLSGGEKFVGIDYDGREWTEEKPFVADVDTDSGYGNPFAAAFLASYRPKVRTGLSVVMCTGTEYSEYLENERDLNVLTRTKDLAFDSFLRSFKPIRKR